MFKPTRNNSGSMGAVILAICIPISFSFGALAVDVAHYVTVKSELQKACDAGALAGAADLIEHPEMCEVDALAVTEFNSADGRAVSNTSDLTTVDVQVVPCTDTEAGTVTVTASMTIKHAMAGIFGRPVDSISTWSKAGTSGTMTQIAADSAFPLAVSIDTFYNGSGASTSSNGNSSSNNGNSSSGTEAPEWKGPLSGSNVGDNVIFYINSQNYKNAAFTSFTEKDTNASWLNEAIDQCLGFEEHVPGFIPSVKVGDSIYLDNGVAGQKKLAGDSYETALKQKPILFLPVMSGDPPFNQTTTCLGFIAIRVTDVHINSQSQVEYIKCKIIRGLGPGTGGSLASTGNGTTDDGIARLSAGPVKMIR